MSKRILAIEISGTRGSLAVMEGARLVAESQLDASLRTTQALAPALKKLLDDVDWQPRDVSVVAVTTGPGSFTGLRIGVTTAKTFAYAVAARVVGIDTLDAIAERLPPALSADATIDVVIDAYRGQVFRGVYRVGSDRRPERIGAMQLLDAPAWASEVNSDSLVTGPALTKYRALLPSGGAVAPTELWDPTAAAVGALAARRVVAEDYDNVLALAPRYGRPSAAEEKRAQMTSDS